jgi:hypothetical protein
MEETIQDVIALDEKVLWKGRRNNTILNTYLVAGLIISILLAIFFFSQGTVEHDLGKGITSGKSIATLAIFIGFIVSFSIYYSKQASVYIITDRKVIVQHGLISKRLGYAYHENIRHVDISHGFLGTFLDVGSIYVDSGKTMTSQMRRKEIRGLNMNPMKPIIIYDIIKDVEHPHKVYNLIERLVEKTKNKSSPLDINTRIPINRLTPVDKIPPPENEKDKNSQNPKNN